MKLIANALYLYLALTSIVVTAEPSNTLDATKTLKILVITGCFPRLSEAFVLNQVIGLLERGHDVYIFAEKSELAKVHENVYKYDLLKRVYYNEFPKDINEFDLVLCQFGVCGIEYLEKTKDLNLPAKLVTFFRGYDISEYIKDNRNCYDELFKRGDYFMSNCEFFRKRCIELGCPPEAIQVCYSSIDCELFSYCERSFDMHESIRIITAGRLTKKKGIEDSIHAVAKALEKYPNIEYIIAGSGYLKDSLEELVKQLGIEKNVIFTGGYSSNDLAKLLATGHIFLGPSVTSPDADQDAIPNTLKEAMATGLPVISTNHGGIPEMVIDGVNGLLVEEHDIEGLTEKIMYLIEHPLVCQSLGKEGRKTVVQNFEINHINKFFVDRIEAIAFK